MFYLVLPSPGEPGVRWEKIGKDNQLGHSFSRLTHNKADAIKNLFVRNKEEARLGPHLCF